jgi:hypothetical protein
MMSDEFLKTGEAVVKTLHAMFLLYEERQQQWAT